MNSSMDRYEYSTLEVDTQAQARNRYAETATQLPEVNQSATEHLNYPEVVAGSGMVYKPEIDRTPPEAVHITETIEGEEALRPTESRICGMRRKVFWGVLIGAIILIVGIVVGATAGVLTARKLIDGSDSDSSSGSDNNGSTGSTNNETALFANTNIATANFTDQFGNENYLVAYQLNNKALYLSAWNSSNRNWVVSPIVDGNTNNLGLDSVRKSTALALDVFEYDNTRRDIHVYWQLPDSGGLSTIKALTYTNDKGITTTATLPAANWVDSAAGNSYISTAGSSLVSYGKQCDLCNQYTYLYWQTSGGIREANYQNASTGWYSNTGVIEVDLSGPSDNSSLAQAHAAAATTEGHRSMNIFYRSTTSGLSQIVNGDGRYVGHYLGRDIGPSTNIAAFSTGYNETSENWPEPLGFQVLTADPGADDGIQLTYYQGNSWTKVDSQVGSLSDCKARATMAANRARRLYCLVGRGDDTEIVEYEWQGNPDDTSTYSNYNRVGTVGTTV
ncbi:hypothetical protein F4818DRAFT_119842 [Hypoxylon cercidicola]|nr:hypothetical protein F4818DRAFT_119842 [Hypoxylon cercidicola]